MDLSEACILIKDNSTSVLPLPDAFLEFLEENGLDSSIYVGLDTIPRYIRLKPGYEWQLTEIETELDCKLEAVDWLPGFFFIPSHIQIAGTKAYQSGKERERKMSKKIKLQVFQFCMLVFKSICEFTSEIYGMDAASGAAVMTLNVTCGDHVLDLCAAPGAKLCMLADLLGNSGTITGVDVARHRLAACRTMLQKYELGDQCRLFVADGTTFSLVPTRSHTDVKMCPTDGKDVEDTFREWTSKRTWTDRKNAAKRKMVTSAHTPLEPSEPDLIFYGRDSGVVGMQRSKVFHIVDAIESSSSGYDKVLVDAECTHDGSIKHIQKFEYWGWSTFERRVLDANRMQNLTCLQLALLTNGFRLLKVGGSLVYSTCSLTVAQNEAVVEQFLSRNPTAELMKVDSAETWRCRSGGIPLTLRFDPKTSQTSGMFIAKFTKNPA